MKLLVTGICGFAGSSLARAWLEAEPGLEVLGLDNLARPGSELNRVELARRGVRLHHGDVRLASDFETLPAVDWVIDAAAQPSVLAGVDGRTSSRQLVEHNLVGTINILEYCRRTGAGFVLLSTSRVYSIDRLAALPVEPRDGAFRLRQDRELPPGIAPAGIREDFSTAAPVSLYGATKLASESLALEYGAAFGLPVWINRCGVLAGAGQFGRPDQGIFAYWINSWLRRRPLAYLGFGGQGHQVRDGLHPRDLVPLLQKQTGAGAGGPERVFNLGGGPENALSLAQLSDWCRERFGPHEVDRRPENRPFDIPWAVMDCGLAERAWGWRPQASIGSILEEIANHAESHPHWLEISGSP